jgi:hypothetical protein
MASEIERLPDLTGFLKLASVPDWQLIKLTPRNAPTVARAVRPQTAPISPSRGRGSVPPVVSPPPTPAAAQASGSPQAPSPGPAQTSAPDLAALPVAIARSRKSRGVRAATPKRPHQPKAKSQRLPIPPADTPDAPPAPPQITLPPQDESIQARAGGADSKN